MQSVLDRIAVLSVQFDDDGTMDVWGFAERHKKYPDVTLDNLDGYVAAIQNTGKRSACSGSQNQDTGIICFHFSSCKQGGKPSLFV